MTTSGSMNHLRLSVRDIPEAEAFYDPLLACLGYEMVQRDEQRIAWAMHGPERRLQWFIVSAVSEELRDRAHALGAPGLHHFAFNADSREQVDRCHERLVEGRAEILDAPKEYPHEPPDYLYEPSYYAVFFLDPNAFKLEVVHIPQATPLERTRRNGARGRAPLARETA